MNIETKAQVKLLILRAATGDEYILEEIGKLMLKGMWAEQHGIPALESFADGHGDSKEWCTQGGVGSKWFHGVVSADVAKEALAQLPKEEA